MMNSEMFNCWTDEIRDYFGVDVSDDTVQLVRNKIESTFLNSLRPKMEWKPQFSKEYGYVIYHCSNCGNDELVKTQFCPKCGAMYVEDEGIV